jgi:curved DNA-binding protein CbpA
MSKTHYSNLQVIEEASPEVIRGAYKALAQKWHPDRNQNDAKEAERVFKIITSAYEVLSDSSERAMYDATLREERAASAPKPPSSRPRHHTAEPWRSQSDYGVHRTSASAKQSTSEPHNSPHTPPKKTLENHPIFQWIFNPPRSVVIVIFAIAWYFVFGKQWTIVPWLNRVFGL